MPHDKLIIGCGYLGRRVARMWVAQGDVVYALTRSVVNAGELRALGVRPIVGDVLDPRSLEELPEADTILYAVGHDRQSGRTQREVYVDGLQHVLSIITPPPRFIYVSSTSVYGQNAGEWVDESSECRPDSSNGQVCLEAERALRRALPDSMILRLAGLYGPGRLVARIEQLRAGAPLSGNPDAWLNLIQLDDAAAATLACERHGRSGETYLVCDNQPCRRRDYYSALAARIGAPAPRFDETRLDPAESVKLNKRCCNRRLREELHVELRYPTIEAGLAGSIDVRDESPL